jgi:hypothetical protein
LEEIAREQYERERYFEDLRRSGRRDLVMEVPPFKGYHDPEITIMAALEYDMTGKIPDYEKVVNRDVQWVRDIKLMHQYLRFMIDRHYRDDEFKEAD